MERDPKSNNKFCGVFSSDTLPTDLQHYPCGLIANTDASTEKGSHWVAFYFPNRDEGEFFDSYGFPPAFYRTTFQTFLDSHSKTWTYNSHAIQGLNSSTCGQFSLYFIMQRNRGKSLKTIVTSFSKNTSVNDHRVSANIHRYLFPNVLGSKKLEHQIAITRNKNIIKNKTNVK